MNVMHTTEAFIVKKEEYGEADLMLTALSEQFGKIKVFAKGVRKQGAKLRGHCELMSKSLISFVEGRNMYRLIHAEVREYYPGIRSNMMKLETAYHCLALAGEYLLEDRRDANKFFALFENTFLFLEREPEVSAAAQKKVLVWFDANFLNLLGLFPEHRAETNDEFPFLEEIFSFRAQPLHAAVALGKNPVQGAIAVKKIFQTYLYQGSKRNYGKGAGAAEEYPILNSVF
ncbi:DNA repair protein RecO [Patescibacteria group bacterium]|nr:DNA repair protein RecO [Patescibacteria group bacterium]